MTGGERPTTDGERPKRAVVTGGASGIGAAVTRHLVGQGWRVAVLDSNPETVGLAKELGATGFVTDVRSSSSVDDGVGRAVKALGGLSGVFANAGVGKVKPLHTYTDEEWDDILSVNLTGVFRTVRATIPHLSDDGGAIVMCAGIAARRATRGEGPYCAAKAGVVSLTQNIALEYSPRIRANCVSPGFIRTAMTEFVVENESWRNAVEKATPLQRIGSPEEVANLVAFLLSDAASYITGQDIAIEGGSFLPSLQSDALLRELTKLPGSDPQENGR